MLMAFPEKIPSIPGTENLQFWIEVTSNFETYHGPRNGVKILGKVTKVTKEELSDAETIALVQHFTTLPSAIYTFSRVFFQGHTYCSTAWSHLKKRLDNTISFRRGKIGRINTFFKKDAEIYAFITPIVCQKAFDNLGFPVDMILQCEREETIVVVSLSDFQSKCIVIDVGQTVYLSKFVNLMEKD
jgi:hypothetical protein